MLIKIIMGLIPVYLVAIVLSVFPLPDWAIWIRPAWVILITCYWILNLPISVGLGVAWTVGFFLDILSGTTLGEHALALTLTGYFLLRIQRNFRFYQLWQQSILICFALYIFQFIIFVVQGYLGEWIQQWSFWFPPLAGMIFWPGLSLLLQRYKKKFVTARTISH